MEFSQLDRLYDHRERYTFDGFPLVGEPLRYNSSILNGQVIHYWDTARHWRTLSKVAYERNRDNGSGYFAYHRVSASQQVRYRQSGWEARLQMRVSQLEYDLQRADDGVAKRDRTSLRLNARVERQLFKGVNVHAEYEWERLFSNREIDTYTVNTVSAGLGWDY